MEATAKSAEETILKLNNKKANHEEEKKQAEANIDKALYISRTNYNKKGTI